MVLTQGFLVALEGIDGTGKTSLASGLRKRLESQGYSVEIFKEPTDSTDAGRKIRKSYLTGRLPFEEELQLFLEDRAWDVEKRILPALEAKKIVLMDRYFFSTACYQGVRNENDWQSILALNREKFPEPDLTIILDIDPKIAHQRIAKSRDGINTFERIDYLQSVRSLFLDLVEKDQVGTYYLIDSKRPLDELLEELYEVVINLVIAASDTN